MNYEVESFLPVCRVGFFLQTAEFAGLLLKSQGLPNHV